jgi:hypothetical protein
MSYVPTAKVEGEMSKYKILITVRILYSYLLTLTVQTTVRIL